MRVRPSTLIGLGAVLACGVLIVVHVAVSGDYPWEAAPAMDALVHGRLHAFFVTEPAYGGSLALRAPWAALAAAAGGGELWVYRLGALPCVLAAGALRLVLERRLARSGQALSTRIAVLALCALTPWILSSVSIGHPEEALGGALCVGAVLLAAGDRAIPAGLALGLAMVNKQWALIALPAVLLAAPRRRVMIVLLAGGLAGAPALVTLIENGGDLGAFTRRIHWGNAGPFDLWWPVVQLTAPAHPGGEAFYRAPDWMVAYARPVIVLLGALLALPLVRAHRHSLADAPAARSGVAVDRLRSHRPARQSRARHGRLPGADAAARGLSRRSPVREGPPRRCARPSARSAARRGAWSRPPRSASRLRLPPRRAWASDLT